jgi:hypothetical protein
VRLWFVLIANYHVKSVLYKRIIVLNVNILWN